MSQQFVEETDSLNELSMNILIHAGNARELLVKGLNALEEMAFDEAEELIQSAHKEVVIAHGLQTDTLQMGSFRRADPLFYVVLSCARYVDDSTK